MGMNDHCGDEHLTTGVATEHPAPLALIVAEDTATNRFLAVTLLEQMGHQATGVENGARAVEEWYRRRPDAILMDVEMPVLDGIAATRLIREREPAGSGRTVIIALTSHTQAGDREKLLAAGFDGYVVKPIREREVVAELQRCCGQQKAP